MVALVLASCGGSENAPQADPPTSGRNAKPPESAAKTRCDTLEPAKVAEISGYPVEHVSEGFFVSNDTDGRTWQVSPYEDDLPSCGYFTEKPSNDEAVEMPYVFLSTTAESENDFATPEEMKCPAAPRPGERCQEVQGVGERALLISSPVEDEPSARSTVLRVVAGGKVFLVMLRAESTDADDAQREEAARGIAAVVVETFSK